MTAAPLHCPYCGEQDLRPDDVRRDDTADPHEKRAGAAEREESTTNHG